MVNRYCLCSHNLLLSLQNNLGNSLFQHISLVFFSVCMFFWSFKMSLIQFKKKERKIIKMSSFQELNAEWNAARHYASNSLQIKDILRCGADDLCRPQSSQTQSQLVWYSHNTSLFVFAWAAAECRQCPTLGAATTEMDVKTCMSLMNHNHECMREACNWPSISHEEEQTCDGFQWTK